MFTWEFNKEGYKSFKKLDKQVQRQIVKYLETNIQGSDNPRLLGKALEGNLSNFWRYRVGKYRIIADIQDNKFKVVVVRTNKRNDVYKKKNK